MSETSQRERKLNKPMKIIKRNKNGNSKCNKPNEANNDFMSNYVKTVSGLQRQDQNRHTYTYT